MSTFATQVTFFRVDGTIFFDRTVQAENPFPNDVDLGSTTAPGTGDYVAIGFDIPFRVARIEMSRAYVGVSEFQHQYWNGSEWALLENVFDATRDFTMTGVREVSWTIPDDWVPNTVDVTLAYHMRILWSAWTSTTTSPRATMITLGVDPVYGQTPIDTLENWNSEFRPPLVLDPEWVVWGPQVIVPLVNDFLESQWLTRWRRALTTAEGEQLRLHGVDLDYLQPVGWTEERYRNVLIALLPATFGQPTPPVVSNLVDALLDVGQSVTMQESFPCSATFTFLETGSDDAVAYNSALDRARARGCQYSLTFHPGGGAAPFTVGTSTIGGPDTLAELFIPTP